MEKQFIQLEINDGVLQNMKVQKRLLLVLMASTILPQDQIEELEGLLNFCDHVQDKAIDELGFDKYKVLDFPPDEDTDPEGFKAHSNAFEKEVKDLDDTIINNFKQKFY